MKAMNKILAFGLILCIALSMGCIEDLTPQYKMVEHKEPIYATLMTVEIDDDGDGESAIVIHDVYDFDYEVTGHDFWGNTNFNFDIFYYDGMTKRKRTYTEMNDLDIIDKYEKIVGYRTWTEKVRIN